mgnify:CR=1 FL=1
MFRIILLFSVLFLCITGYLLIPFSPPKAINIFDAVEKADIDYIKQYIKDKKRLDEINYLGRPLLVHVAAYPGITVSQGKRILRLLLDAGCDINMQSVDGKSPLLMAVKAENHELAIYLLRRGANPNLEDENGDTPLTCYYNNKNTIELIEKLIANNADINHKNKDKINAISLARYYNRKDIEDLLVKKVSLQ